MLNANLCNNKTHVLQTKVERCVWFVIVCLAFASAGIIIGRSLSDWQDSPIATSITTRPLEELAFPQVTICPREGTNTALNHDLIKAENNSLNGESRATLQKAAYDIFTTSTYQKYIDAIIDLVGNDHLKDVF